VSTVKRQDHLFIAAVIGVIALHVFLSIGQTLTLRPWSDEGSMACPAYNLITNGGIGTTIWEETGSEYKGINTRTYCYMPLDLWTQAAWYSMVGFGLIQMRMLSTLWAVIALVAWSVILRNSFARKVAILGVLLIAVDYAFVGDSSSGRMDMMSAALGFSGLAVFLTFRERNLTAALLVSNALVAASILTHAMGIVHFAGLQILTLYFSRKNLKVGRVALAATPYLVAGAVWSVYILQSPSDFVAQFSANAHYMHRLSGLTAPWMGIVREITDRYGVAFGLGAHSASTRGPVYLKAVVLAAYVGGFATCLIAPDLRRNPGVRWLATLSVVYFLIMSVIDGGKAAYYLVHILPLFAALLAIAVVWIAERRRPLVWPVSLLIVGVVLIQVGALAQKMRINTYANRYAPVVAFLKQNLAPGDLIFATSAFGFDFGFRQERLIDDSRLGYYSGKRAAFIVVDEIYKDTFAGHRLDRPEVALFVDDLLRDKYRVVYAHDDIEVYGRLP
jgi:4-amino-4-deoxy-L-arabinose transferase-like glycosyltransferase